MYLTKMDKKDKALVVFQDQKIRRIWHEEQWFFSVVDIVGILTDSVDSKDYWYRLKQREKESSEIELSTFCRQLKLPASDGKNYLTDCADTESMFRIVQSIPSKNAEPFTDSLVEGLVVPMPRLPTLSILILSGSPLPVAKIKRADESA